MTQPVSFNPARAVGERRIAIAAALDSGSSAKAATAHGPKVPLSKLTELARRLAAEGPPIDNPRIAQLSQAIATGSYRIDVAAIADAMLHRLPQSDQ